MDGAQIAMDENELVFVHTAYEAQLGITVAYCYKRENPGADLVFCEDGVRTAPPGFEAI